MRAVSLHPDVIVLTSALLQVNCVIVRGGGEDGDGALERATDVQATGETFVIDSPVLPDELDALPALIEQAGFHTPSGLLATHGDWDHLLGRLAFPYLALGCAQSTAERLAASPGDARRELRAFDEQLMIDRPRPFAVGSVQALPVPGRCALGKRELELHRATGHTADGMAIALNWARVLVAGDYLSTVEIPTLNHGGDVDVYLATLERLRPLLGNAEHVVPGHGPILDGDRALAVLDEDARYLRALVERGPHAVPPRRRNPKAQHAAHTQNLARVAS